MFSLGISLIAANLFKLKRIANIKCRDTAVPYEAVPLQTVSHNPAMCPKTTAQFLQSPTDDARST